MLVERELQLLDFRQRIQRVDEGISMSRHIAKG